MGLATQLLNLNFARLLFCCVLLTSGCNDAFMQQSARNKTTSISSLAAAIDSAGNVTAEFDPNSLSLQLLRVSSGALAGAAIAVPVGAFSVPLSITVGEGEALASSSFTQELGLTDNNIVAAGPSVSFVPNANVEASSPFTLSLPMSTQSALAFALDSAESNVVVMYRWTKIENGEPTYVMGIIPGDDVTVAAGKVSFQTTKFGVFQIGKAERKITERLSKPTIEPPTLKGDASNPLVGLWGACEKRDFLATTAISSPAPRIFNIKSYTGPSGDPMFGLSWVGGIPPFKILRSMSSDCQSATMVASSIESNSWSDVAANRTSPVYYQVVDSGNRSTTCFAGVHKAQLGAGVLSVDSVAYVAANTIKIAVSGADGVLSFANGSNCPGPAPSTPTLTNSSVQFSFDAIQMFLITKASTTNPQQTGCLSLTPTAGMNFATMSSVGIAVGSASSITDGLSIAFSESSGATAASATLHSDSACMSSQLTAHTVCSGGGPFTCNITFTGAFPVYGKLAAGASSACVRVHKDPPSLSTNPPVAIMKGLSAFSNGIESYWSLHGTATSTFVKLYNDFDCDTMKLRSESAQYWNAVFPISDASASNRRFSLKAWDTGSPPNSLSPCVNVMLPDAANRDWKAANSFNLPTSITNLAVFMPFVRGVDPLPPDLRVAIADRGSQLSPNYSYSINLSTLTSSSAGLDLVSSYPMSGGSTDNWATIWAPPMCTFFDAYNVMTESLPINAINFSIPSTGAATVTVTANNNVRLVCPRPQTTSTTTSTTSTSGSGGGDYFGFLPQGPFSIMRQVRISSSTFTHRKDYFSSTDCSGKPVSSITESGVYGLPPVDVEGTIPIDITTREGAGIIFTPLGVEAANRDPSRFGCSIGGWVIGQSQSLQSGNCVKTGVTDYTRVKIEGNKFYPCGKGGSSTSRVSSCSTTAGSEVMDKR